MSANPGDRVPSGSFSPVPAPPPWAGAVTAPRQAAGWRRPLALALLVAGCLLAPLALAGWYVHTGIMDADGYVATVAPVAGEPAVRDAVADVLAGQIAKALDEAGTAPLPGGLGDLAGELVDALPFESLTRDLTEQALASSAFQGFWNEANRKIHPLLVAAVKGKAGADKSEDPVTLDLAAVTAAVTDLLAASGVGLPEPLPEALTGGGVALFDSVPLARAGSVLLALDRFYLVLTALAVAALAGAVLTARDRLRAGVLVGAGLVAAMAALQLGLLAGRSYYLGVTDRSDIPHAASAAVFDVVTSSLRDWGWAVLVAGAALAVACLLVDLVLRRAAAPVRSR